MSSRITAAVDRYTSEFNSAVMDLAVINRNRDPSSPCYLPTVPTAAQAEPGARPSPDDPHRALTYNLGKRVSSCMLYEVLLFQPWVNGQFGTERQLLARNPSDAERTAELLHRAAAGDHLAHRLDHHLDDLAGATHRDAGGVEQANRLDHHRSRRDA